ncbi:MAG: hypothetical protein ACYCSN_06060 [Acidobacteriaceae bacterium]
MTAKSRTLLIPAVCIAFASLSVFMVFRLPFLFPPMHRTMSISYAVGFNNKIASLSVMALSLTAFLLYRFLGSKRAFDSLQDDGPISSMIFWIVATVAGVYQGILAYLVAISRMHWGEATYFLEKLPLMRLDHLRPYRDFEFAYGPLMLYVPRLFSIVLARDRGDAAGYFVTLILAQMAGLWLLYWTLNNLPMRSRMRSGLFLVIALTIPLSTNMGLNYTLLRFCLAAVVVLFLARQKTVVRALVVAGVGVFLQLAVSPEWAVACSAGCFVFCLGMVWERRAWQWLIPCLGPPLAFLAILLVAGSSYFSDMSKFSYGYLNDVVSPTYPVLLFLLAAIWIAPYGVACALASRSARAKEMLALYMVALAAIPAALGRCDGGHILFNGMLLWCLAVVAASWLRPWAGYMMLTAFVLAFCYPVWVAYPAQRAFIGPIVRRDIGLYANGQRIAEWAHRLRLNSLEASLGKGFPNQSNAADIRKFAGNDAIGTPAGFDWETGEKLRLMGLFHPEYYYAFYNLADAADESQKVHEMEQVKIVMVPTSPFLWFEDVPPPPVFWGFHGGEIFGYHVTHQEYRPGTAVEAELHEHWQLVGTSGIYSFYRRRPKS